EESFGIRQNHKMYLSDWHALIQKHFSSHQYVIFVPERGWGERVIKRMAIRFDPFHSEWRAARLLGGTLAAFCKKAGEVPVAAPAALDRFEQYLRCPDCKSGLERDRSDTLRCVSCGYTAANEGAVFNLLASADRAELYPGDREDAVDFSLPD